MKMTKIFRLSLIILLIGILVIALSSCGGPSKTQNQKKFTLISVNGAQHIESTSLGFHVLNLGGSGGNGHIDSGPPEYLKVTLKKIELDGDFNRTTIWDGGANGQEITISGSGEVDLTGIAPLLNLPTGTATAVRLTISSFGKIKGQLLGARFSALDDGGNANGKDYYTNSDYYYDNHTTPDVFYQWDAGSSTFVEGGVPYTAFNTGAGTAGETTVILSGGENSPDGTEATIVTDIEDSPVNANSTLTILVDISRMLRFYDGYGLDDSSHNAAFFSDSVFKNSIACFIGSVGEIRGYQTDYAAICPPDSHTEYVTGWMTLIFNPSGDFLSGIMMADDDNALCVAKGTVKTLDTATGSLTYELGNETFTIASGFQKGTDIDNSCTVNFSSDINSRTGSATFTLKYLSAP
ncbi:MAG TPA: hypothetical protein VHY08_01115 [Bacillota bacterium]|nr:hypothetical protein [Bacillota bacterium]